MSNYFPNGSTTVTTDCPTCGACVYWGGRKNVMGNLVEYDMYEKGRCNNFQSPAYGKEVNGEQNCGMKENF